MNPNVWQMVPVEPTEEMLEAADDKLGKVSSFASVYRAMLAAAPPTEPCEERFSDEELELMNDALAQLREGGEKNKRRANLLELAMTRARFPNPTEPSGVEQHIRGESPGQSSFAADGVGLDSPQAAEAGRDRKYG